MTISPRSQELSAERTTADDRSHVSKHRAYSMIMQNVAITEEMQFLCYSACALEMRHTSSEPQFAPYTQNCIITMYIRLHPVCNLDVVSYYCQKMRLNDTGRGVACQRKTSITCYAFETMPPDLIMSRKSLWPIGAEGARVRTKLIRMDEVVLTSCDFCCTGVFLFALFVRFRLPN